MKVYHTWNDSGYIFYDFVEDRDKIFLYKRNSQKEVLESNKTHREIFMGVKVYKLTELFE